MSEMGPASRSYSRREGAAHPPPPGPPAKCARTFALLETRARSRESGGRRSHQGAGEVSSSARSARRPLPGGAESIALGD